MQNEDCRKREAEKNNRTLQLLRGLSPVDYQIMTQMLCRRLAEVAQRVMMQPVVDLPVHIQAALEEIERVAQFAQIDWSEGSWDGLAIRLDPDWTARYPEWELIFPGNATLKVGDPVMTFLVGHEGFSADGKSPHRLVVHHEKVDRARNQLISLGYDPAEIEPIIYPTG